MDFQYFQTSLLNKTIQGAKGNYKILGLIAAGTGGMVMQGLMDNKTKVAVKYQSFISEHETNVCLRFLENEFTNIVNIRDIFKNQGHPGFFIIMDFADMPLTKYINGKIEFGNTKSLQFQTMIKQICCGIHELHQMKIIHRDFKPDNIVVQVENNQAKKYMLCDLGLVRSDENDFKKTKQIGTPMFMAPELLNEEQYSVKVDIWALGCMLYSLLARKHLFEGNTVQETLRQVSQITQQQIDTKINQIQNLDQEFKQLLIKMIQIKQSDRLTIEQVIEQINNYYNNQQQEPINKDQLQMNTQFLPQQIILNQKAKLLPQQQLKIEHSRIQNANEIQCNQMKDKLLYKLNEQQQQLVLQYCKKDQQYNTQYVQQIIQQVIQMVQSKSFDIIEQLYVIKLESDKKIIMEQLGQKDLKQNGILTELNQKQMEINKNKDQINNLNKQIQTFINDQKENEDKINDLSCQLKQCQSQIHSQNQQILNQSEEINVLKVHLESSIKALQNKEQILQNKDQIHLQEINKHLSCEGELQSEIHSLKQNLANMQQEIIQQKQLLIQEIEKKKQQEIDRLLEENQKYFNQCEQQKQFIQQKEPEFESIIEELNSKLKSAEEKLDQVKQGQQQQNEKQAIVDQSINKNQVMLGYLKELTDYILQQENPQKIEINQMKNDILPILNNNEQKQNAVQSVISTKTNFTQQMFSPNHSTNIAPQNNFQQQNGQQQQFQFAQNLNIPSIQQQYLQQKQTYFQNSSAQQFQPVQNLNNYQLPHNFANYNCTPLQFLNQNALNPAAPQQEQINSQVQQPQSGSQFFKINFNPNIQKPDQK